MRGSPIVWELAGSGAGGRCNPSIKHIGSPVTVELLCCRLQASCAYFGLWNRYQVCYSGVNAWIMRLACSGALEAECSAEEVWPMSALCALVPDIDHKKTPSASSSIESAAGADAPSLVPALAWAVCVAVAAAVVAAEAGMAPGCPRVCSCITESSCDLSSRKCVASTPSRSAST